MTNNKQRGDRPNVPKVGSRRDEPMTDRVRNEELDRLADLLEALIGELRELARKNH